MNGKSILYITIFITLIIILGFVSVPENSSWVCNHININLPEDTYQKYKEFIELPANTVLNIELWRNSQQPKKIEFAFVYQYPYTFIISHDNKHHKIKLERNRTKKLVVKVFDNPSLRTYYKFTAKLIPKKVITLESNKIVILKKEVFSNTYTLRKFLSKYHKVIIEVDECGKYKPGIKSLQNKQQSSGMVEEMVRMPLQHNSQTEPHKEDNHKRKQKKMPYIFIIFDKSGSLNEFDKKPLKLVKRSILSILNALINKEVKLAVGAFDDKSTWLFENIYPGKDSVAMIKNFVSQIIADGGTNLYRILKESLDKRIGSVTNNFLIIITDGFVYPANFDLLSKKLQRRFKNIILIGAGKEINVDFLNHLANLLKATVYLISGEDDIQNFERELRKIFIHISTAQSKNSKEIVELFPENKGLTVTKPLTNDLAPTLQISTYLQRNTLARISFSKLYLIDKNNIYTFNINSMLCNIFSTTDFEPFAYNEFLHNILFRSKNHGGKIIISTVKIASLLQNHKFKKKLVDVLYDNNITTFTRKSDEIGYKKNHNTINMGNYLLKIAFSKFKVTKPYNNLLTINKCNKRKNNYNNSLYMLWISLSIAVLAVIRRI